MAWILLAALHLLWLYAQGSSAWNHTDISNYWLRSEIGERLLVAYVKPEEPASAALEEEWLAAVDQAPGPDPLISIDCSQPDSRAGCLGAEYRGYPSIYLEELDHPTFWYQGPRRAGALLHWMARLARPLVPETLDADALAKFKTADETVFVAYLGEDTAAAAVFADIAFRYREEFSFGTVTDPEVIRAQGLEPPAVVCYKLVDGDTVSLNEIKGPEELDAWIKEASRPVLSELTVLNHQRLLDRGSPMVYVFAPTERERQALRKVLYKFAKNHYDSLTSATVDPFVFPDLMAQLGLEPGVFPAGAVHQLSKDRIYHYPKGRSLSASALQEWGLDVYQGRIKPWTPLGVTTTYEKAEATRTATRRVSIKNIPEVKIRVAGRDEL